MLHWRWSGSILGWVSGDSDVCFVLWLLKVGSLGAVSAAWVLFPRRRGEGQKIAPRLGNQGQKIALLLQFLPSRSPAPWWRWRCTTPGFPDDPLILALMGWVECFPGYWGSHHYSLVASITMVPVCIKVQQSRLPWKTSAQFWVKTTQPNGQSNGSMGILHFTSRFVQIWDGRGLWERSSKLTWCCTLKVAAFQKKPSCVLCLIYWQYN